MWWSAASLGLSALGAANSYFAKREAADLQRAQAEETARRIRLQHEQVLGEAKAAGAASGIEYDSSSLQSYLSAMRSEFSRQESWALTAGRRQADATGQAAGWGLVSDLGGSLFNYGAQNNWWGAAR